MGKMFDEFAKSLASGQTRRGALKKLAIGAAGALGMSVLGRDEANAVEIDDENNPCVKFCKRYYPAGYWVRQCLRRSARYCPWGYCSADIFINSTTPDGGYYYCVPANSSPT
jgi:hypothetical protein